MDELRNKSPLTDTFLLSSQSPIGNASLVSPPSLLRLGTTYNNARLNDVSDGLPNVGWCLPKIEPEIVELCIYSIRHSISTFPCCSECAAFPGRPPVCRVSEAEGSR